MRKDFFFNLSFCDERRKHELVEEADSVWSHPAGESSGPPKYALWGDQPSKPPHALWLTPFRVSSSTNYSRYRPQEHSFCHKKATQYSVVSPGAHVITEWKSTDTRRDRSVPNTFVHWCYVFVHVLSSGSGAEQERDRWKWSAWSRLGLVMSPGLSNVSWLFYYSWCKNL